MYTLVLEASVKTCKDQRRIPTEVLGLDEVSKVPGY